MHGRTGRWTNGQTHDRQNAMTIARWPSPSGAKNLGLYGKELEIYVTFYLQGNQIAHPCLSHHYESIFWSEYAKTEIHV